ncbi:MAG TPA: hypothetical protein ENF62_00005 [Candidatus Bathyarchaeota archaeon]|nr:hypothetical protein [Candidatus Bathyarchaeota archaeon]
MKPLSIIYWSRAVMGVIVGVFCGAVQAFLNVSMLMCIVLAIAVYVITHRLYERSYRLVVENPRAITTTGLDAYLLLWLVFWTLTYTLLLGLP